MNNIDVVTEIKSLYVRMGENLKRAEQADNWQAIRAFHAEARQDLELLARLLDELREAQTIVNFLTVSPEWLTLRAAILGALEPYPEAQRAISTALVEAHHAGN